MNPVQINFHLESILWLNSFLLNLHENLLRTQMNVNAAEIKQDEPSLMYMDVKMEAIMPRVSKQFVLKSYNHIEDNN